MPIWCGSLMTIRSFSFLLLASWSHVFASDTIQFENPKIDVLQIGSVLGTEEEWSATRAHQEFNAGKGAKRGSSAGFTSNIFWVQFSYRNSHSLPVEKVLEIDNPQIDWLYIYVVDSAGVPILVSETGDKHLFAKRPIQHRNFALPLRFLPGEAKTVLIQIDKRNSSLTFPIYLWDAQSFHEKTYNDNLWFGLFFGIIVLCLAYALMAFIFLRTALYGWYFLLVFASGLYLFTSHGFSFQYLYPEILDFNSYLRVYLIVTLFLCMMKFSQNFLSIPRYFPLIHKTINAILILFGTMALVSVFALDFMTRNGLWVIPVINSLSLVGGLLLIYSGFRSYKHQPITVIIYFSAWGSLLLSYLTMTAGEFGIIPVEKLPVNPVLVGSSLETFIFSVGLTYQIRKVYNERNELSLTMARQQKDLLKAYVDGTEKERERISRELHDDIGSRLGSLKRFINVSTGNSQILEEQIDILCRDVRSMSHQLAPPTLRVTGLRQLLQQLVSELTEIEKIKIDVQFYDVPENLSEETTHHLFRISQEALNNVVKHAHATEVDLQLFGHEQELVLTIEDNGKGFNTDTSTKGIGMNNIRARTESLNGSFDVSSQVGRGTSLMIRVPIS